MLSLCCHVLFLLSSGKPAKLNVQNAPIIGNVRIKAMRNTYEFDQHVERENSLENRFDNNLSYENDVDDNLTEDSKSNRQKLRRKEQRSHNKRAPIEAFSEEHFVSESRRR
jgi:hypothetical protein